MMCETYVWYYESPLGKIRLVSNGDALLSVGFELGNTEKMKVEYLPVFAKTNEWFDCYFDGKSPNFIPKLTICDTPFRTSVWEILKTIPYGQTVTYGDIANKIAKDRGIPNMSAQAVGNAVGRNPFAIIIPCHRVIAANGKIGGYYYGVDMKIRLLELEKAGEFEN